MAVRTSLLAEFGAGHVESCVEVDADVFNLPRYELTQTTKYDHSCPAFDQDTGPLLPKIRIAVALHSSSCLIHRLCLK